MSKVSTVVFAITVGIAAASCIALLHQYKLSLIDEKIAMIKADYEAPTRSGEPCGTTYPPEIIASIKKSAQSGNVAAIKGYAELMKESETRTKCLTSMNEAIKRITANFDEFSHEHYPAEAIPVMVNRKTHIACVSEGCAWNQGLGVNPGEPEYPKELLPPPLPLNKFTMKKCRKFGCGDDDKLVYGDPGYPKKWWKDYMEEDRIFNKIMHY